MASGHGLRLRAGPVSADDACRARAAFSRVRVGATQRRVYELLRREQDALGNTDPTEAELQYMWEGAGIVASLLIGDRQNRAGRGAA